MNMCNHTMFMKKSPLLSKSKNKLPGAQTTSKEQAWGHLTLSVNSPRKFDTYFKAMFILYGTAFYANMKGYPV